MEGILQLKKDAGGYRHYIELPDGEHDDINCGSALEVQMGDWVPIGDGERLKPGDWLKGRYEGYLGEPEPRAYLYIGYSFPGGYQLSCTIPVGARVRRPKK